MKQVIVTEKDLAKGSVVWIKRRRCTIVDVHPITGLRLFQRAGSDKEYSLTRHELQLLVRKWDIVPDRIHQALPASVREVLSSEWHLFDPELRERAEARAAICRALDRFGPVMRRQEAVIERVIAEVSSTLGPEIKLPSPQRIRRHWDLLWIASLKDPRSLLDLAHLRGNRRPYDKDSYRPVIELVEGLITEFITSRINKVESLANVQQLADDLVSIAVEARDWRAHPFIHTLRESIGQAALEKHPIPLLLDRVFSDPNWSLHPLVDADQRHIGANLVRNRFRRRNFYERMAYRTNRKEARRLAAGIGEGPIVDLPLQRVEGDSTVVDQLVVIVDGKPKRMEITFLKDKCSGAITGLHHSFEKSNWFTMHEAIRMSALPKQDYLNSFKYKFVNDWPIVGVPDVLVLDRHATHRGSALAGMATKLGFEIDDMPAASGHLKGGVEKGLGDFMHQHIVSQPGYVGSNAQERDPDKAAPECTEQEAVEAAVAYVVDYYNQQIEPGTGEIRIHRFKRLMDQTLAWKMPPDPSLFPGKPVSAKLTVHGIKLNGLKYRSPELTQMFFEAGGNVDVVVFIPRYQPDVILVGQLTGAGHVEGYLQGRFAGLNLSHDQALAKHREAKRNKATPDQRRKARDGRVNQVMTNDVGRGKPRRAKVVTSPPTKAGANLAIPPVDQSVSLSREFSGHNMSIRHDFETYNKLGGAYARPGPASRAIEHSIDAAARAGEQVPALPQTTGFSPDVPNPNAKLPVSVVLASDNTASSQESKPQPQPESHSELPSLPEGPFKL